MGLTDGYIAGIFVSEAFREQGIGTALLAEAKRRFSELSLHVYVKNEQAVQFYENEKFYVCEKDRRRDKGRRISDEVEGNRRKSGKIAVLAILQIFFRRGTRWIYRVGG